MSRGHCIQCGAKCDRQSTHCWPCHRALRRQNVAHLTPPNPSGLCQCGCGQKTNISPGTDIKSGAVIGHPVRFVKGHQLRPGLIEYTVNEETDCWDWIGHRSPSGHATKWWKGRKYTAHAYMWIKLRGPIPEGLELDHLCRNPGCVNPDHLEPVTHVENVRRGRSAKLTVEQVREIRASTLTRYELAKKYGVSHAQICAVINRRAWREVE